MTARCSISLSVLLAVALSTAGLGIRSAPGSLSMDFALEIEDFDGTPVQASSGTLIIGEPGSACLLVGSPIHQEMKLHQQRLWIYYPDTDLALVRRIDPNGPQPLIEVVLAGLADTGAFLPEDATLVDRHREGDELTSRWQIPVQEGSRFLEAKIVETREGSQEIVLTGPGGEVSRRLVFTERVRVRGVSVPRSLVATHFDADGREVRQERWRMTNVAAVDDAESKILQCAQIRDTTTVTELP